MLTISICDYNTLTFLPVFAFGTNTGDEGGTLSAG